MNDWRFNRFIAIVILSVLGLSIIIVVGIVLTVIML